MDRLHFQLSVSIDPSMAFMPDKAIEMTLEHMAGRITREIINKLKTSASPARIEMEMTLRADDVDVLNDPFRKAAFDMRLREER